MPVRKLTSLGTLVLAMALAACAVTSPASPSLSQPVPQPRAERLAEALAAAETAAADGDEPALRQALVTIDRLGATPLTDEDKATLNGWKTVSADAEPPMRGRTLGPAYRSGRISAGQRAIITQTFYGGEPANVSLRVAKGSPLRIRITDKTNRNVCEESAREASCRWMPLYTQVHQIELVNTRDQNSRYYIAFD